MSVYNLNKMFEPKNVAVIGASEKKGSVGAAVIKNLIQGEYKGDVYPINPNHSAIFGRNAYASVRDLKPKIDLAVISIPIIQVPQIIHECILSEVGAAVIISAGGKETGIKGKKIEDDIMKQVKDSGLRIIGPNCLGVMCGKSKLNASFAAEMPIEGKMAFISQSGAICGSILDLSIKEKMGFSYFVSLGSMIDVDFGDLIDYFGGNSKVGSIVMYIENVTNFRKFMSAARSVSRVKPIVALKAGRTKAGAMAAASHTGALAGEDAVYDAAFKRAGIVRVRTFEELFDCAELLSKQPKPKDSGLVIITNSGGPGVMAADALSDYGINPIKLRNTTIEKLNQVLPEHWSHANPIDILGDSASAEYRNAADICIQAPEVDGILIMLTPQAMIDPTDVAKHLVKTVKNAKCPVITSWMGSERVEKSREIFNLAGIPTFNSPERAIRAFMDLFKHSKNIEMLQQIPKKLNTKLNYNRKRAKNIISEALLNETYNMTEVDSKALLESYGIPVNRTYLATTEEEAVKVSEEIGYPVVMKIISRDILHKSDANGVKLNLCSENDVFREFRQIIADAKDYNKNALIDGVSIQPMIKKSGCELILGSKKDRDFGPVILFGMGGTMTELIKDRALALPPLNRLLAKRLMEETKVFRLIKGYRNFPPVNLEMIEEILIRLSQLVTDFSEIKELDINPMIVFENQAFVLDVRVVLESTSVQAPSHLVISSYPNQYESIAENADIDNLMIRPIRPEDAPLMESLFQTLSKQSIYYRFFRPIKSLSHDLLARFTQIDYDREMALVALQELAGEEKMLGVGRFIIEPNMKNAEFSILIGDPWQGKGVGAELLKKCIYIASERNIEKIYGIVLAENSRMLALGRKLGFNRKYSDLGEYELSFDLNRSRYSKKSNKKTKNDKNQLLA